MAATGEEEGEGENVPDEVEATLGLVLPLAVAAPGVGVVEGRGEREGESVDVAAAEVLTLPDPEPGKGDAVRNSPVRLAAGEGVAPPPGDGVPEAERAIDSVGAASLRLAVTVGAPLLPEPRVEALGGPPETEGEEEGLSRMLPVPQGLPLGGEPLLLAPGIESVGAALMLAAPGEPDAEAHSEPLPEARKDALSLSLPRVEPVAASEELDSTLALPLPLALGGASLPLARMIVGVDAALALAAPGEIVADAHPEPLPVPPPPPPPPRVVALTEAERLNELLPLLLPLLLLQAVALRVGALLCVADGHEEGCAVPAAD